MWYITWLHLKFIFGLTEFYWENTGSLLSVVVQNQIKEKTSRLPCKQSKKDLTAVLFAKKKLEKT